MPKDQQAPIWRTAGASAASVKVDCCTRGTQSGDMVFPTDQLSPVVQEIVRSEFGRLPRVLCDGCAARFHRSGTVTRAQMPGAR